MNAMEFEEAVRELLRLSAAIYIHPHGSEDRKLAWKRYDRQEAIVADCVDMVMAIRKQNESAKSEREAFFLLVADLIKEKRLMKQNGYQSMNKAWGIMSEIRKYLSKWTEEREAARKAEIDKQQLKLEFQ